MSFIEVDVDTTVEIDVCDFIKKMPADLMVEELIRRKVHFESQLYKSPIVSSIEYSLVTGDEERFTQLAKEFFYERYGILGK